MANLDAISQPPEHGATRILLNGTKQGGNDDFASAAANSSYFTIRMPIWLKKKPSTLKNVFPFHPQVDPFLPAFSVEVVDKG